ncbi:MAG TPA: alpha/beta fold hydrolase [Pyrinomonadaceae bacterium]|nr:alpha/beta fold hydrolase [Pyrinomonadaceae bacterium]
MDGRARVRGIEMVYTERGQANDSAPIVLLHGFPLNRAMWDAQAAALSRFYRFVAPDLRGHGETSVTEGAATMEEMARDLSALLDELGIGSVVLGGLSMGGYVAFAFYTLFPERVRALVLADTRAQSDNEEGRRTREETAQRALAEGMEFIAETMLPKLLAPTTPHEQPETAARVRQMILSMKPAGAAAALRGMAVRADQTALLQRIHVPTLIIVGDRDAVTPRADAEKMHASIAGSRLEVIEGAGHVSNMERPAEFNRALESFLRAL